MTKDNALKLALEALEKLWNIIDDIDTYGDMAKGDEKLYRALVERRQRTRFEETGISTDGYELTGGVITVIKKALVNEALEKKAQNARELGLDYEPVAFASHGVVNWIADKQFQHEADLYTTPQRTWVGLSDVNAIELWQLAKHDIIEFARVIEAKLKESNTSLS